MYVMYKYNINIMNRNKFVSNLIILYWELMLRLFNWMRWEDIGQFL